MPGSAGYNEEPALSGECGLSAGQQVVLGLSGGRDSVALLLLLLRAGVRVSACHVHHGIRGAAADADAAFCRQLCVEHGADYAEYAVDVPALAAARGESLETVARCERRRLLAEHARRCGCNAVALAHHADDQAETVLFHLARGSAGLRGMRAVSYEDGVAWLRPLLRCRRSGITRWLQAMQQGWCDDATNAVPDVTRNALRLQVMPALAQAMGRDVVPIINRSARLQQDAAQALEAALDALPTTDPQGRLYLPFLQDKAPALQRAVVHRYLQRAGVSELSERLVLAVCELLQPGARVSRCNLPGKMRARRCHKRLFIEAQPGAQGS